MNSFLEAIENRRTIYDLSSTCAIPDDHIERILEIAIKHSPSAFNSQSSRITLLKGREHKKLWSIVLETLEKIAAPQAFEGTKKKIGSFSDSYATVLYFEDQETVETLQKNFPSYAANFPIWSNQASGILQFVIWTALAQEGLGASLQHYNPLIDEKVKETWSIPQNWKLIAQMPFGDPAGVAGEKTFLPIDERLKVIG
ncbi:MAG: nitroreductase family protein [Clostridiales bacterium]|jgi:predicted oxidoreductase (fatty acid repression mutant protein)|nr:nitroreductase family protein [Clostridiales bacterium]